MEELSIRTPWEELEDRFNAILMQDKEEEEEEEEYQSCFRIEGRPLLPPLLSEEGRRECLGWRERAREREEEQRRQEDEEDSSDSDSEVVVYSRAGSVLPSVSSEATAVEDAPVDDRMSGAFKSLIHRLRGELVVSSLDHPRPVHHDSMQSVDTVVENPEFMLHHQEQDVETRQDEDNHANDEEEDPPPVMRRRSGSYTLSEPSPLLRAYMDRYGEGDMSFSSSSNKKKEPKMTAEEALGAYLESISRMPGEVKVPKIPQTEDKESEQFAEKEEVSEKVGNEDVAEVLPEAPAEEIAEEKVEEVDEAPAQVENPPENAAESPEKSLEEEEAEETPVPPSESVTLDTLLLKRPGTADTFASSCITVTEQQQHQQQIESAVSTLAQEQRRSVLELVEEQERQRRALNEYFREQQQKLIEQIMASVQQQQQHQEEPPPPTSTSTAPPTAITTLASKPPRPRLTPLPFDLPPRSGSPVLPAAAASFRPISVLPQGYEFPEEALAPEMHQRFCLLSALARGFLTRRLFRTHKVQSLVSSIRDAMSTALQLHRESSSSSSSMPVSQAVVTPQDVELHRRLLMQINKDCQSIHHVFFGLGVPERMSVIAMDHEIRRREQERRSSLDEGKRRVSAATLARLEERERVKAIMEEEAEEEKRRRRRRSGGSGKGQQANCSSRRATTGGRRGKENRPLRSKSAGSAARAKLDTLSVVVGARRSLYGITDGSNSRMSPYAAASSMSKSADFSTASFDGRKRKKKGRVGQASKKQPWK